MYHLLGLEGDHQAVGNERISTFHVPCGVLAQLMFDHLLKILAEVSFMVYAGVELMVPIHLSEAIALRTKASP